MNSIKSRLEEFGMNPNEEISQLLKGIHYPKDYNPIDEFENQEMIPIGGDVIIGSNIASTREEYLNNPIEGMVFGKTFITCNTLIWRKL